MTTATMTAEIDIDDLEAASYFYDKIFSCNDCGKPATVRLVEADGTKTPLCASCH